MQALWIVFQLLLMIPFLSLLALAVFASLIGGEAGLTAGIIAAIATAAGYITLMSKKEKSSVEKKIISQEVNADFVARSGYNVIAIESSEKNVLAGNVKGKHLKINASEIEGVKLKSKEARNTTPNHLITISTNIYDTPYIEVRLPGSKGREAYEKLRVLLSNK
ncbi:hypothetical protein [Halomonas elongata]|uniref:hypothetical protein n=1 Tax=Halomonas elongata TaxID=2746 RepID=UPI00186B77CC|nr:hypothetical protein [Halomonas elongata]MBW5798622.1 hypothetical protein [Halomonas elongata]